LSQCQISTIAPAKAAQLAFLFWMVMFIVNGTPVRSLVISDFTNDEGLLVGNGPAVSDGVTLQVEEPEELPVSVAWVVSVALESVDESSSPPQELNIGIAKDPNPTRPNPLKKSFLSILNTIYKVMV
jgi:hypothetical protein